MECPYCHGEMEPGTHVSGYASYWLPQGTRWRLTSTERKIREAGGFRVGRPKTWQEAEAWYCRTCNRLIILDANAKQ